MATDLSALLDQSKALTSHLARPDLPSVQLGLDQIEALSRRLGTRQPISGDESDKACVYICSCSC
jgi:nuclear pore complex protein Nup93